MVTNCPSHKSGVDQSAAQSYFNNQMLNVDTESLQHSYLVSYEMTLIEHASF